MGFIELFFIAVGLSMDAFAVSVCKGLCMPRIRWGQAVVIALFFGGFQGLMPLVGWVAGSLFASYITAIDHWIAFVLLVFIGGKMLWDAFHEDDGEVVCDTRLDLRELTLLAIATSIDALAVGITFAFLGVDIWAAVAIIGATTFVLSLGGVVLGHQFGSRFEKPAAMVGGAVLIVLGVKILLEHLGILG